MGLVWLEPTRHCHGSVEDQEKLNVVYTLGQYHFQSLVKMIYYLIYVREYVLACMSMYPIRVWCHNDRRVSDPLKLELYMVVNPQVGAGN